jgi:hypothetical protein
LTAAVKDAGRAGIAGVVEVEVVVVVVDAGAGMAFVVEVGIAVGASVAAALRVSWNVCDYQQRGIYKPEVAGAAPCRSHGFGGDAMVYSVC